MLNFTTLGYRLITSNDKQIDKQGILMDVEGIDQQLNLRYIHLERLSKITKT
jgi:hypothetical protein